MTEASASFEFRDLGKSLEIAGQTFTISAGDVDGLQAAQELQERFEAIDIAKLESKAYMAMCTEIMSVLDDILGEGACARIFTGRRVNIIHLIELLKFVVQQSIDEFESAIGGVLTDLTDIVPESK